MTNDSHQQAKQLIATAFQCEGDLATLIAGKATYRDFPPRSTILVAGAEPLAIYLVISGHARSLVYSLDGRLLLVEEFYSGDLFGEVGLFMQQTAASDITSADMVHAGLFLNHVFISLMENYSAVGIAMARLLTARLSATTRRMVEGATLSATGRIHAELLRQAQLGTAMTIRPAPVLSAFAQQVLSTRETVSRTINALEKRGIIRRDENGLTVVAPHRLEEQIY